MFNDVSVFIDSEVVTQLIGLIGSSAALRQLLQTLGLMVGRIKLLEVEMTTTIVDKKSLLKTGTPRIVNSDGVIVMDPNGAKSYLIDTTIHDGKVCKFSSMAGGADVSYAALYALAKTAFPASFP